MQWVEVNFDGLVGPTHHFGGLAVGNLASQTNSQQTSHPRQAAIQGLEKMHALAQLGVRQGVLPIRRRPAIDFLRAQGYHGNDAQLIKAVASDSPPLLSAASSASSAWAANTATVSPSADSADHKVHFTVANLSSQLHRSIEAAEASAILHKIFPDPRHFTIHPPLPAPLGDEGAANHTRLCNDLSGPSLHLFVYGRRALIPRALSSRYPARQTLEASQSVARLHQLQPNHCLFLQQSQRAIDAGAFHNDVVATGHRNLYLFHESAYENADQTAEQISTAFFQSTGSQARIIVVRESEIPLTDAVSSYLFNSQIVTTAGHNTLIAPGESQRTPSVQRWIDRAIAQNLIHEVRYVQVNQSMQNGGGPACLRLRVLLSEEELSATHPGYLFSDALYERLRDWINRCYREELRPADLADERLLHESQKACDELDTILNHPPSP